MSEKSETVKTACCGSVGSRNCAFIWLNSGRVLLIAALHCIVSEGNAAKSDTGVQWAYRVIKGRNGGSDRVLHQHEMAFADYM